MFLIPKAYFISSFLKRTLFLVFIVFIPSRFSYEIMNIDISKHCICKYHNKVCSTTPSIGACNWGREKKTRAHTHTNTRTRTHTRARPPTHARTHTLSHTHTHTQVTKPMGPHNKRTSNETIFSNHQG